MQYNQKAADVAAEVPKAVFGKPQTIRTIWMAMLSGGHVLIEDIPGVGKTTLALAFARALELNESRVQFTPDVLPSDIVGFTVFQKESGRLVYHPGSVMCNLFLGDEINRTSSRTQSALLEVMEEGTVTVDGVNHPVPARDTLWPVVDLCLLLVLAFGLVSAAACLRAPPRTSGRSPSFC